jgi:RNA polymerase sigma-70 factor (ECF subfamily)
MSLSSQSSDASSHATSPTLVARVQANEQAAWQRLVDLYGPLIYSWACRGGLANKPNREYCDDCGRNSATQQVQQAPSDSL